MVHSCGFHFQKIHFRSIDEVTICRLRSSHCTENSNGATSSACRADGAALKMWRSSKVYLDFTENIDAIVAALMTVALNFCVLKSFWKHTIAMMSVSRTRSSVEEVGMCVSQQDRPTEWTQDLPGNSRSASVRYFYQISTSTYPSQINLQFLM